MNILIGLLLLIISGFTGWVLITDIMGGYTGARIGINLVTIQINMIIGYKILFKDL